MKAQKDLHTHRAQNECTAAEANEDPSEYRLTCDLRRKDLEWLRPLLDGAGFSYSISRSLKNVPNEVQPLFRFELFFDGTYQGVGFLQGLDDMCEPVAYRRLMKPFKDSLPVPMNLDQPSSFWFTEKGLQKLGDAIDEINVSAGRVVLNTITVNAHSSMAICFFMLFPPRFFSGHCRPFDVYSAVYR